MNNAAAIHDEVTNPKPFWEKPLALADILDVGLRSAYVASWFAAPLMVAQDRGLIAFTSSPGSVCYMHGPAYGAQKAGVDKLAADMAVDFDGTGVCTVSIWMGILLTEKFRRAFDGHPEAYAETAPTRRDAGIHRTGDRRAALGSRPGRAQRPNVDRRGTGERATTSPTRVAAAPVASRRPRCAADTGPLWWFADAGPGGLRH